MEWTQHTFQQKNPNEQKEEAKEDEDHSTITTTKKYGMKEMHAIQINTNRIFSFDNIEFFFIWNYQFQYQFLFNQFIERNLF